VRLAAAAGPHGVAERRRIGLRMLRRLVLSAARRPPRGVLVPLPTPATVWRTAVGDGEVVEHQHATDSTRPCRPTSRKLAGGCDLPPARPRTGRAYTPRVHVVPADIGSRT
jgi:hypothetical protein